jgi:hypothetical protein
MNEEKREAVYPLFALPECLRLAEAIRDLGGARGTVSKSLLAQHLKVPEASLSQRIGAAKAFKLVEGHASYFLSDTAKRYFYPASESQNGEAALEMLSSPRAFKVIIQKFNGDKLPKSDIIANIMHREAGVPVSWKTRAASFFIRSAQFLGAIDGSGFLRYGSAVKNGCPTQANAGQTETSESGSPEAQGGTGSAEQMIRFPRKVEPAPPGRSQWVFPFGGTYIRLETPEKMTKELWDKLQAYVQILKPAEEPK